MSARVLLVSQPTSDGVAACVRDLARAGTQAGFDVAVACPTAGELPSWAKAAGADWIPLEMTRSPGPGDALAGSRLRRLYHSADLVHLHSSKAGAVGRLGLVTMVPSRRPPCVFTPHYWSWLAGGTLAPVYRLFERATAPLAQAIVVVSAEEERWGRAALGRGSRRIRLIENGVDTNRFTPEGPADARRDKDPLVVCVGRLDPSKGQDLAVEALAAMNTRARLRLVGRGGYGVEVAALAKRLGVAERVKLVGYASNPEHHYRAADVVVLPSRGEALALRLLEAMACGAAIVMTATGGASALGEAGVVVPVNDPTALAVAIDGLLGDSARRALLGRLARSRAVAGYRLGNSVAGVLDLWNELVG